VNTKCQNLAMIYLLVTNTVDIQAGDATLCIHILYSQEVERQIPRSFFRFLCFSRFMFLSLQFIFVAKCEYEWTASVYPDSLTQIMFRQYTDSETGTFTSKLRGGSSY
jgi:hypothetical protein